MTGVRATVLLLAAVGAAVVLSGPANGGAAASAPPQLIVPRDFPTIQAAVDAAAPGSTIHVKSGMYTEQVVIGKDLTILGAGAASTIVKSSPTLAPYGVNVANGRPQTAIVRVGNGAHVRISDLAVSGPVPCGQTIGVIALQGAALELSNARVHDVVPDVASCSARPRDVGVAYGASPRIQIDGQLGSSASGRVTDVTVDTVLTEGLVATAPYGLPPTKVTFADDLVTLGAPQFPTEQFAIDVFLNAIAQVSGNVVSGAACTIPGCGPDPIDDFQAMGVFVGPGGSGSSFSGNQISGADVGIYQYASPNCCTISQNTLQDNRYFGIVIQDGDGTTTQNTINGGEVGIGVVADAADTTGVLRGDSISGTTAAPVREIQCCGFTATAIVKGG